MRKFFGLAFAMTLVFCSGVLAFDLMGLAKKAAVDQAEKSVEKAAVAPADNSSGNDEAAIGEIPEEELNGDAGSSAPAPAPKKVSSAGLKKGSGVKARPEPTMGKSWGNFNLTPVPTPPNMERQSRQDISKKDVIIFLDAFQEPHGYQNKVARVLAVSKSYAGRLIFKGASYRNGPDDEVRNDSSIEVKPGEAKCFPVTEILPLLHDLYIQEGEKNIQLFNTNKRVPAYSYDNADINVKEFDGNTEFYIGDTEKKHRIYTIFHFSGKPDADLETDRDTVLYIIGLKDRFTLSDPDGSITIQSNKMIKNNTYYLTIFYFNSEFCYQGGINSVKMKYTGE